MRPLKPLLVFLTLVGFTGLAAHADTVPATTPVADITPIDGGCDFCGSGGGGGGGGGPVSGGGGPVSGGSGGSTGSGSTTSGPTIPTTPVYFQGTLVNGNTFSGSFQLNGSNTVLAPQVYLYSTAVFGTETSYVYTASALSCTSTVCDIVFGPDSGAPLTVDTTVQKALFDGPLLTSTNLAGVDLASGSAQYTPFASTPTPPDGTGIPITVTSPVPEPSSLLLLGTGILGAAGTVRRRLLRS